jgi:chemotaxis signal transduction protein
MEPSGNGAAHAEHVAAVLRERARALAREVSREDPARTRQLVVVVVAGERYGIDVHHVREVHPRAQIVPLPGTPPSWTGLMNLRGTTYPVLDLARFLGLPSEGDGQKVVLVSHGPITVALLVDRVLEVLRVPVSDIRSPFGPPSGGHEGVVTGLTQDLLSLLDVPAMLGNPALAVGEARAG